MSKPHRVVKPTLSGLGWLGLWIGLLIPAASTEVEIEFDRSIPVSDQAKLRSWIDHAANQLSRVGGRFPIDNATIILHKTDRGRGPVPWARVQRYGGEGIHFYINPHYSEQAFVDDWTALHEFSHLLIPYPGNRGIWFSEGLASYYQNLLRARAGVVSPEKALQDLNAGFERGRKDARRKGRSLAELSPQMWQTRSYMRVYWSGAAYFLNVDVALRQQGQSLDQVIAAFLACCRQQWRRWDEQSLIATFDELSGDTLFQQHYEAIIEATDFPSVQDSYRWLGVQTQGRSLRLDTDDQYHQRRAALLSWQEEDTTKG